MKVIGHMEKWGVGVLGLVSLLLLVNLVLQFNRGRAGEKRPGVSTTPRPKARTLSGPKEVAGKQKLSDELSPYDSLLKLDLLKQFADRPLPELARNPFEFVEGPTQRSVQPTAPAPAQPPPPPPPPPVTLKPMGYSEGNGGIKEAMVSDEDQVFVVHEGDSVGTRYKIIKITPTLITVEDAIQHQTVDLPVPP
jgi:hypothetical protein